MSGELLLQSSPASSPEQESRALFDDQAAQSIACVRIHRSSADRRWHQCVCVTHKWVGPIERTRELAEATPCGIAQALAASRVNGAFGHMLDVTHVAESAAPVLAALAQFAVEARGERGTS